MNNIVGLVLNAPRGFSGFRVVSNDRNACPHHFGVFATKADAEAYLAAEAPDHKVVAFKVR